MFYVYVLISKKDRSQYVGMSEDVKRRLCEHNFGRVTSTKSKRPWSILCSESYKMPLEAREREKYLKTAAGRRYRKKMMGD